MPGSGGGGVAQAADDEEPDKAGVETDAIATPEGDAQLGHDPRHHVERGRANQAPCRDDQNLEEEADPHDGAEDRHIGALVAGHHHNDLGGAGDRIEQEAEGEQHQDQPAIGIGGTEEAQDLCPEQAEAGEDAEGEDEARPGAERGNGLSLAHVAGMKMLGHHGRDDQFDGEGE